MYTIATQSPESLLKYILALVYSFVWQTEAMTIWVGDAPPPMLLLPLRVWHSTTPSPLPPCFILTNKHTQPHLLCSETRSSKTSEVGANPESRLTLAIHQLLSTLSISLCLTQIAGEGDCGNLLPPAYARWIRESFATFSARCILSCPAYILPPEKWSLLTFQGEVNRRGQMKYSLCFPYVQFHCNCTTCNFLSDIDSHVFSFL